MTMTVTYDYDSFRSDLRKKMHRLGTGRATKSDEFSEKFQRGEGVSLSIQKFIIQILGTSNRAF